MRAVVFISSCLVLSALFVTPSYGKDFGKHGTTFEIAETPIFKMIRDQLKALDKEGRLDEVNEELKRNSIAGIEKPPAVGGLSEVVDEYSFTFDPTITVQEDIDDTRGNIIAKAGTTVNPLDNIDLGDELLFVMGDKPSHLKLAEKIREERSGRVKVIFVSGEPLQAMRDNGYRIYFDQGGHMVRHFQINRVPALVSQEDRVLRIREVPARDL